MQLLTPLLPATVQIRPRADKDCEPVLADPSQLLQVIMNLCSNANQAMGEEGGILGIEVRNHVVTMDEARLSAVLIPGPHVKLIITDNGPGMDDFTLRRIFDPFFTTRRRDEGTGLGLSVVHGIITQLKGTIEVSSQLGHGSRFEITLPCCAESVKPSRDSKKPESASLAGHETVLFVDDEAAVAAIAEEALTKLGYIVIITSDAVEALRVYAERSDQIDLVVTDQTMPNMTGRELAHQLREISPDLPIILMSGAGHIDDDAISLFLGKPFSLNELPAAIRQVMRRTRRVPYDHSD